MIYKAVREEIEQLLIESVGVVSGNLSGLVFNLEKPKERTHGDFSSNLAFQLSKRLNKSPLEIASQIFKNIKKSNMIERVEVARPGFINFHLKLSIKQKVIETILENGASFGRSTIGKGEKVLLEFVSANPTGPLHIGHGRGAAIGAVLANILESCGYEVEREYYVNDAGRQVDILTISVWYRYLELFGIKRKFPAGAYQGSYIIKMAKSLKQQYSDRWTHIKITEENDFSGKDEDGELDEIIKFAMKDLANSYDELKMLALQEQLKSCKKDLGDFGVFFDNWFSERSLFSKGKVATTMDSLKSMGHVKKELGSEWFCSSVFGDDKDRVLKKSNGDFTYFASDVAYHIDKYMRGFTRIINLWGADHHGYIPRIIAALRALNLDENLLSIKLIQFASLFRDGKKISMSTRSGEFVTLRDLFDDVGVDAARFFYAMRKSDQHLDFDLSLAKEKNTENPVFYVQYAHARCSGILAKSSSTFFGPLSGFETLDGLEEADLLQCLMEYDMVLEVASLDLAPHLLTNYLRDLSTLLHRYYNSTPILLAEEPKKTHRIALIAAVRQVIANGLSILGVTAPESM